MHAGVLKALEFDRVVEAVARLALTAPGLARLAQMQPATHPEVVRAALGATTEAVRFAEAHGGIGLRAPDDLDDILRYVAIVGRGLEPLRLLGLATYLESVDESASAIRAAGARFPALLALASGVVSFRDQTTAVRRAIDASGEVADHASPTLASIRERLRGQRARLRSALDGYLRDRDTAKYLQEQVVTDRNGRYVLVLRAEHRASLPGIVHGASTSGASLFVEPLATVEINNDIVALSEAETEEVLRILLQLTDAFRARPTELSQTIDAATGLDVVQARARFSRLVGGVEPLVSADGTIDLREARHPLLMGVVNEDLRDTGHAGTPVPITIVMAPPAHVLLITGPNTGGKTVALKTVGLLAAMAQAGLHVPAADGSRLPVFRSIFADIGDEQSISASLSTFSAHVTNLVSMIRQLDLPALVLLDEVGAGTDPAEGGALGIAVIDHFRSRGAHLVATTHYDVLKSYASTTSGVISAAFGFDPETFAPTYVLHYGSPGRSLAIEIAARLGMPPEVVAAARDHLGDRERLLSEHLTRIERDMHALQQERREVATQRLAVASTERGLAAREQSLREREALVKRRLSARLDDQVTQARREIDRVIGELKSRVSELAGQAAATPMPRLNTGEAGAARAQARAALEEASSRARRDAGLDAAEPLPAAPAGGALTLAPGARVVVAPLGLEGTVLQVVGGQADVDVRGKRLRAATADLRVVAPAGAGSVSVNVDLQPREQLTGEINVIGCTVDEALARVERFIDESLVTDRRSLRVIHGHGTGQLRRALTAFLREHPMVAQCEPAPPAQGGGGVTTVELRD
ncbi:MAG: endonuclease MutS2 [Vicinamibacterales bacterium]